MNIYIYIYIYTNIYNIYISLYIRGIDPFCIPSDTYLILFLFTSTSLSFGLFLSGLSSFCSSLISLLNSSPERKEKREWMKYTKVYMLKQNCDWNLTYLGV